MAAARPAQGSAEHGRRALRPRPPAPACTGPIGANPESDAMSRVTHDDAWISSIHCGPGASISLGRHGPGVRGAAPPAYTTDGAARTPTGVKFHVWGQAPGA